MLSRWHSPLLASHELHYINKAIYWSHRQFYYVPGFFGPKQFLLNSKVVATHKGETKFFWIKPPHTFLKWTLWRSWWKVYFLQGIQGVSSHTVISNLALREGKKDISDILGHFFQENIVPIRYLSLLLLVKRNGKLWKNKT